MENMSKSEEAISKEADFLLQMREKIYKLELLKHVKEMRALQKDYFRTRDKDILALSKQKEKEVDQLIDKIESVSDQTELNFESNPNCQKGLKWMDCKEIYDNCGECPLRK